MSRQQRKLIYIAFWCIYITAILVVTVFRKPLSFSHLFENAIIHPVPFVFMRVVYDDSPMLFSILFFGNIFMFTPFGVLAKASSRGKLKAIYIILFGLFFSAAIEFLQFMFAVGEAETDDLILNTLGVILGIILYKFYSDNKVE